jgi:hypothetical protein
MMTAGAFHDRREPLRTHASMRLNGYSVTFQTPSKLNASIVDSRGLAAFGVVGRVEPWRRSSSARAFVRISFRSVSRNGKEHCVIGVASSSVAIEGGSTHQCGKQVLVSDHVNDLYYKMVGSRAMYQGYQLKQRNAGYKPKRKSSYKRR